VRRITNYGLVQGRVTYSGATNAKLSEYAAAVGLAQLARRAELLSRRLDVWQKYRAALSALPKIRLQAGLGDAAPAMLSVHLPSDASDASIALNAAGIETRRWYLPPLHEHPLFGGVTRIGPDGGTTLPVTENMALHHLGLPFHAFLADSHVASIAQALGTLPDDGTPLAS
jgi:dTDP-4-amino-4,6-dideoxygalactose transaminase